MNKSSELPYQFFRVSSIIAKDKNIPASFMAMIIKETPKAVLLEGHGIKDPSGICSKCGRKLTHPGSILIGIGPECVGSWTKRQIAFDNMTEEDSNYIKTLIETQTINSWFPKSLIKNWSEIDTSLVYIPESNVKEKVTSNKAEVVKIKKATLFNAINIKIEFTFDREVLEKVKTLSKRNYNAKEKVWYAPATFNNIVALKDFGFEIDEALNDIINKFSNTNKNISIEGLKKELLPFQKEGVEFFINKNGRAIIGDEMGLGKTVQALGYIHYNTKRPALIICPASLKMNWKKEAEAWIPNVKAKIVINSKKFKFDDNEDVVIINYDLLNKFEKELMELKPKIVIIDECHSIKSSKTKKTKAALNITKNAEHIIALSGTPAVNRPVELYNTINLVDPYLFPSFFKFALKFCGAKHTGFGWNFSGSSNTDELNEILKTIMIRRKKIDVLSDLPEKRRSIISIDIDNEKEYREAEKDIVKYVSEKNGYEAGKKAKKAKALVMISNLRQLAARGALANSFEWIDNFIEGSDQKLVIFAVHKEIIDKVMNRYKDISVKIDGSVKDEFRDDIVTQFQENPNVRIFVGNIKAAGVGLTLTAASNVVFLELPWSPGLLFQAEDRCHRYGQKSAVNIWYLIAQNTVEETFAKMIDSKRKILEEIFDGKTTDAEKNIFDNLINSFKEEN